ncbi:MAG TPA: hypothetical protein VLD37_07060 [Candidatus Bilamarchaeum sp.]|nr:hypothetical protein [Candidatus Bilamarchaeum sp.]
MEPDAKEIYRKSIDSKVLPASLKLIELEGGVLRLLENAPNIENSKRKVWISDFKRWKSLTGVSWHMMVGVGFIDSSAERQSKYANAAVIFLRSAKVLLERISSALKSIPGDQSLEAELSETFKAYQQGMESVLMPYERPEKRYHGKAVIKIAGNRYRLQCSVCGERAAEFDDRKRSEFQYGEGQGNLYYYGVARSPRCIEKEKVGAVSKMLEAEDFRGLDEFLRDLWRLHEIGDRSNDAIDVCCLECGKVYCVYHYGVDRIMDDTFMTCPKGHQKMIYEQSN